MEIFTFDTLAQFREALRVVRKIGVDYESQPDELTIVTDELTPVERTDIHVARDYRTAL